MFVLQKAHPGLFVLFGDKALHYSNVAHWAPGKLFSFPTFHSM